MKTMSYTESRACYAEVFDSVVFVSLEDYEAPKETAYLMRSPANARRLLDAMERLESGRAERHELIDAD